MSVCIAVNERNAELDCDIDPFLSLFSTFSTYSMHCPSVRPITMTRSEFLSGLFATEGGMEQGKHPDPK